MRVEYYFHGNVTPRYTVGVDYFLTNETHVEVYVGGHTGFIDGFDGDGTHGSYPFAGVWPNINAIGTDETVDGLGLHIDFANYQNIALVPNLGVISPGDPLDWMTYGAYWGHPRSSPSAGENFGLFGLSFAVFDLIPLGQPWVTVVLAAIGDAVAIVVSTISDDTRIAALGPATKGSWNNVYYETGASIYTEQ